MDYKPFKKPFVYDEYGYSIMDANGNKVIDIRGWGYLTGKGTLGLASDEATDIQDNIGRRIAQMMNEDAE